NNPTTGIAGGTATVKSADGGATYTAATSPGVSGNINGFEGVGMDWWAIRSGATIYRSTNGATTWTDTYTQTGAVYQDIDFVIVNGCPIGWAVGNLGVVSKMSIEVGIVNTGGEIPVDYTLGQNYPNPFNPETNINFTIPKSGNVTLKIYDVSGKEVSTLVNEVKNAGNYIVGFNAANLPSGAYFYRLESSSFSATKKMMLIK
ncbi:MAG: T9SS type A sorting domain-containing protein, partial [Ignavibacteria bacterium]